MTCCVMSFLYDVRFFSNCKTAPVYKIIIIQKRSYELDKRKEFKSHINPSYIYFISWDIYREEYNFSKLKKKSTLKAHNSTSACVKNLYFLKTNFFFANPTLSFYVKKGISKWYF